MDIPESQLLPHEGGATVGEPDTGVEKVLGPDLYAAYLSGSMTREEALQVARDIRLRMLPAGLQP